MGSKQHYANLLIALIFPLLRGSLHTLLHLHIFQAFHALMQTIPIYILILHDNT